MRRSKFRSSVGIVTLLLLLPSLLPAQPQKTDTLAVRIVHIRNTKGKIWVALFQSAQGFPEDDSKAFRIQESSIDPQTLTAQVVFANVPQGVYAVSTFHDENLNGKVDKNLIGIPKEGYGTSNNPGRKMRPPTFEEAHFSSNTHQPLEIRLIYW